MTEKIILEFFPEMILEIPECVDGCCSLKPVVMQSKESTKMHILAQHIQWMFKKRIELIIPSKTDSRIRPVKKYKQFKSNIRIKKLGIKKLPALVLNGKLICEGCIKEDKDVEEKAKHILKDIKKVS